TNYSSIHDPYATPPNPSRGDAARRFPARYGLNATSLAEAIGVSRQSVNELLRERRSVSPTMALRLAKLFGNSPEFWLNAQRAVDLWDAAQEIEQDVSRIRTLTPA
ncbi:MAG: HigA family addiction module antidote protein, partial [Caldilinea sp.]|nr:HigA family addiction module antidote protein [Caldilinea sp.]